MRATVDRLAFSTLGLPGAPLSAVAALAVSSGWRGLELRSAQDEPVHAGLSEADLAEARRDLTGANVLAIASYVQCASPQSSDADVVEAILAEVQLAHDLGAAAVRVFPGAGVSPGEEGYADREADMVRRLQQAADQLPTGCELWLETHDSHQSGAAIARVLEGVARARVRAIWDIAHPIKAGEAWRDTLEILRPHLAHVQIKDERPGRVPLFLGEGDLPIADIVRGLEADGYQGWYSLEYERKWFPAAPPLEQALTRGSEYWSNQGL